MFACSSQKNDRRLTTSTQRGPQELDPVVRPQSIIDETHVMAVQCHGFESLFKALIPGQCDLWSLNLRKEIARNEIIVLVILDQQHLDDFRFGHRRQLYSGNFTAFNQYCPSNRIRLTNWSNCTGLQIKEFAPN